MRPPSDHRKPSDRIYERYKHLAKKYAATIYGYKQLSFTLDDVIQELSMKIVTSIKAYGRKWAKYRRGEEGRPMPIKNYLETACKNKVKDFMKYISRENYKVRMDDINYDFGVEDDYKVNVADNEFVVRGIDLLEGLTGKERAIFSLYLRGYNKTFLNKVYYSTKQEKDAKKEIIANGDEPLTPADIIEMQINYLLDKYGADLRASRKVYCSYSLDED